MKVFISQSGPRSHLVAETLRTWLPSVIQSLKPWLSSRDLKGGRIWSAEVQRELQDSRVGIICITASNQDRPWIQFEAGACASAVDERHAIPYLIDLDKADLKQPLANLQVYTATKNDSLALLQTINDAQETPLDTEVLKGVLEKWWPDLEQAITEARAMEENHTPERSDGDKLDELLEHVRRLRAPSAVRLRAGSSAAELDYLNAVVMEAHKLDAALGDELHVNLMPDDNVAIHGSKWSVTIPLSEFPAEPRAAAKMIKTWRNRAVHGLNANPNEGGSPGYG